MFRGEGRGVRSGVLEEGGLRRGQVAAPAESSEDVRLSQYHVAPAGTTVQRLRPQAPVELRGGAQSLRFPASVPEAWVPCSHGDRAQLWSSAHGAVTKCHQLGGCHDRNPFPHRSGGWPSKIGSRQGRRLPRPLSLSRGCLFPPCRYLIPHRHACVPTSSY